MFQTRIIKKQLHFKQPAGTSRGVYTTRNVITLVMVEDFICVLSKPPTVC